MANELKSIKEYSKNNLGLLLYTLLITLVTYGIKLFHNNYGMDTLQLMEEYPNTLRHWLEIGRPGMYVSKRLLFNNYTNVYLQNVLGTLLFSLSCYLICYLVFIILKQHYPQKLVFIIPSLFITSQVFTYQYYFVLQNFEFSLAMCLAIIAAIINYRIFATPYHRYSVLNLLMATVCLTISLSIYQSFVVFFIVISVFSFLLATFENQKNNVNISFFSSLKAVLPNIFTFSFSLLAYLIFNKFMQAHYDVISSSYLSNQSQWGKLPITKILPTLFASLKNIIIPSNDSLTYNYILIFGLLFILIVILLQFIRKFQLKLNFILGMCFLLLSGLAMVFVTIGIPTARAMVPAYPFLVAAIFFVCGLYLNLNIGKGMLTLLVGVYTVTQIITTTNLYYSDQMKFEEDQRRIAEINYKINTLGLKNQSTYKIMLVGNLPSNESSIITNDIIGLSMFKFGDFTGDSYAITENIRLFMQTMGIKYQYMTHAQYKQLLPDTHEMTVFPAESSIKIVKDTIIVKLSE